MKFKSRRARLAYLAYLWFVQGVLLVLAGIVFHRAWLFAVAAVSFVMFLLRIGSYLNAIDDEKRAKEEKPA